jgi:hypothetical protein
VRSTTVLALASQPAGMVVHEIPVEPTPTPV